MCTAASMDATAASPLPDGAYVAKVWSKCVVVVVVLQAIVERRDDQNKPGLLALVAW